MAIPREAEPEIVSVHEVARAAGVPVADVRSLLASGEIRSAGRTYVKFDDAAELVGILRAERRTGRRRLFVPPAGGRTTASVPLAASGALHAGLMAALILFAGLGLHSEVTERRIPDQTRLVFLATPGPGGGGGGGGLRNPAPPPEALLKGKSALRSPVSVSKPVERLPARKEVERQVETPPAPVPVAKPEPPPPAPPPPAPPVVAPVVSAPADPVDRAGVVTNSPATQPSNGSGSDGGTGTGRGSGSGEGTGAGIGDGTTAGTGGGPYRPGSGIAPPALLREVKPIYTEDGRRRGIEGDVELEVVVRADGSVGAIRILRGLGAGLDQRASEAVRQWRFSPARRFGTPVDVLVEVSVEFRLR
jgi:TonB family protein